MSKTLAEKYEDLRQTCIRTARHMKMVAKQDRKQAASEGLPLRSYLETSAKYLEEEAELLTKAAEGV